MVSGQGHAVIGFSGSNASEFVGAYYSRHLATAPPGTMSAPALIKAGEASYNRNDGVPRNRWGDYSYTTLDPEDDMTPWTLQQYAESGTNNWGTWVRSIAAPAPTLDNPNASASAGTTGVTLNLTGTKFYDPGSGFTGRLQIQLNGGAVNGISNYDVTYHSPTSATLTFDIAANASTGKRDIVLTNPDGQSVTVVAGFEVPVDYPGTSGDDVFSFSVVSGGYNIKVNSDTYFLDDSVARTVAFAGLGGNDVFVANDGAGSETATLRVGWLNVAGTGYTLSASSVETIRVNAGAGADRANLYDSANNDNFYGRKTYSYLTGNGFFNRVDGFDEVYAYGTVGGAGGLDQAYLYDSSGNDSFYGRPTFSDLAGSGFFNRATGFDKVYAYGNTTAPGGLDQAFLYDSAGDDTFRGRPTVSDLTGGGFFNRGTGFDKVFAYATAGGVNDRALFYDSTGNDSFYGRPTLGYLSGNGFYNQANAFDKVFAYATAGDDGGVGDRAFLYDSTGNDSFYGRKTYSYLTGNGFFNQASGFDDVSAYANAGDDGGVGDRAFVYDASSNDTFYGRSGYGQLTGNSFLIYAQGFDRIYAYANQGGFDTIDNRSLSYLFFKYGKWEKIV